MDYLDGIPRDLDYHWDDWLKGRKPPPGSGKIWGVFGDHDDDVIDQMIRCVVPDEVVAGALMADGHLGYSAPIGSAIMYDRAVSPSGVGYDIACGNKAVRTDADAIHTKARIAGIMDRIWKEIGFGVGQDNPQGPQDHVIFDDVPDVPPFNNTPGLIDKARRQLGSVGSGNHYVNVFEDHLGYIWVGVHFGSRGIGHTVASYYLKEAGAGNGMHAEPTIIHTETQLGQDYIAAMEWAGRYAYAGRNWVCDYVVRNIIQAAVLDTVHNNHNYAWQEDGWWVVRKGATPLRPGQRGFVGSTMTEPSVVLRGSMEEDAFTIAAQMSSMYSTVHGAGRAMGRNEAAGKWKYNKEKGMRVQVKPGALSMEEWREKVDRAGVELRGGGLDEAPMAYKRLDMVLDEMGETLEITETLRPIGVAMAGEGL